MGSQAVSCLDDYLLKILIQSNAKKVEEVNQKVATQNKLEITYYIIKNKVTVRQIVKVFSIQEYYTCSCNN